MKMKLFNRVIKQKKGRLGVDIGSHAVKAVELSRGEKNEIKIKNIGYAPIEGPATKEKLTKAIKAAAAKASAGNNDIATAISGPSVVVRFIELPRMSETELRNAIPFEAEKYIPFGIDEVMIDHQLLIPQFGNNQMLVLLVAVKKDLITERLDLIGAAGLSASVLDVTSFANANAFLEIAERKKEEIAALIDVGAKAMDISIIEEGVLYFTRNIQLGGADVTKALSEALSVDMKTAEDMKTKPEEDKKELIKEKTAPILRNMIDETRLSFSYYENQSGKTIIKTYITGGGAKAAGFYEMFKDNMGMDVVPWDPVENMKVDEAVDSRLVASLKGQLGVAIGLALR